MANAMSFSDALTAVMNGKKVSCPDWTGFIYLVNGSTFTVNRAPLNTFLPEGTEVHYKQHIDYFDPITSSCQLWCPTQTDLFRRNYYLIEV